MKKYKYISALTIAGNDGSGGAGMQADIKTFSALGCFATSVLTALPVQNTQGVRNIFPIEEKAVEEQVAAILDDIFPQAIKIGMVHTSKLVNTIVNTLKRYPPVPIVFDPVMVSTSGHRLIDEDTVQVIIEKLFPVAEVITPNMDEAGILAGMKVQTVEEMFEAGPRILKLGCKSVLLKGGHLNGDKITSVLFRKDRNYQTYESEKIDTCNTHGSGCTLSSAIAAYIAHGKNLQDAVAMAQEYVFNAIKNGSDVVTGKGNGPLNHFFNPQKLIKHELV